MSFMVFWHYRVDRLENSLCTHTCQFWKYGGGDMWGHPRPMGSGVESGRWVMAPYISSRLISHFLSISEKDRETYRSSHTNHKFGMKVVLVFFLLWSHTYSPRLKLCFRVARRLRCACGFFGRCSYIFLSQFIKCICHPRGSEKSCSNKPV